MKEKKLLEKLKKIMQKILYFLAKTVFWIKHYFLQIVLLFIILSASFFIFREFYYFGTLKLYVSNKEFEIYINDKLKKSCNSYNCELTLPKGKYNLEIKKDGFYTYTDVIDIPFNKILENSIVLEKNSTDFKWIESKGNKKPILFPIKKYHIEKTVPFLNLTENNILMFKLTNILEFNQAVYISSDEIGQNAWIIDNNEISRFSFYEKNMFPVLQGNIKGFKTLKDGSFLWENNKNEIFHHINNTNKKIDFESTNINFICMLANKNFAYLKKHNDGTSFIIYDKKKKNIEKTIITNLFPYEISYIECSNSNSIKGVLKSGKTFLLDF